MAGVAVFISHQQPGSGEVVGFAADGSEVWRLPALDGIGQVYDSYPLPGGVFLVGGANEGAFVDASGVERWRAPTSLSSSFLVDLSFDDAGNTYLAYFNSGTYQLRVDRVTPDGEHSTVADGVQLMQPPMGFAVDGSAERVYVALRDYVNESQRALLVVEALADGSLVSATPVLLDARSDLDVSVWLLRWPGVAGVVIAYQHLTDPDRRNHIGMAHVVDGQVAAAGTVIADHDNRYLRLLGAAMNSRHVYLAHDALEQGGPMVSALALADGSLVWSVRPPSGSSGPFTSLYVGEVAASEEAVVVAFNEASPV